MRGRGIDTPRLQKIFSPFLTQVKITQVFESGMSSLVLWCSGYHICFTRRRSPVRPWAGSDIFLTTISSNRLQVSQMILNCIYPLPSVTFCLVVSPYNKQYRGSCSLLDTTQLCTLSHTWTGLHILCQHWLGQGLLYGKKNIQLFIQDTHRGIKRRREHMLFFLPAFYCHHTAKIFHTR